MSLLVKRLEASWYQVTQHKEPGAFRQQWSRLRLSSYLVSAGYPLEAAAAAITEADNAAVHDREIEIVLPQWRPN
ncbi:MAG TPA: hypothetical protein VL135_00185 [Terracidiphilus sp.]|nr:hypothetical protein [Terracidiphilus sp.]